MYPMGSELCETTSFTMFMYTIKDKNAVMEADVLSPDEECQIVYQSEECQRHYDVDDIEFTSTY